MQTPGSTLIQHDAAKRAAQEAVQRQLEDALIEMKQAYESYASALKLIAKSREKLNKLNFHLNSFLPISKIPREILVEIFSHCLCKHEFRGYGDDRWFTCHFCKYESPGSILRKISSVCVYWKTLVQQSPVLWKIVPMHEGPERMNEAFSLSRRAPLFIQMHVQKFVSDEEGWRYEEAIQAVRNVFKRLYRVEDLTIDGWPDCFDDALEKYTGYQAPILRRLAVSDSSGFTGYRIQITTFRYIIANPCPSLRTLLLRGFALCSIVPSSLPQLQRLHISGPPEYPPFREALSVLSGLPSLRTLRLKWYRKPHQTGEPSGTEGSVSDKPTMFPNLRSVRLLGDAWHLLGHLQAPSAYISMQIDNALPPFVNEAEPRSLQVDRDIPSYFACSLHTEATAVVIRNENDRIMEDLSYEVTTKAQDGLPSRTISATLYGTLHGPHHPNHNPTTQIIYTPISALYGVTLSSTIRECTTILKSSSLVSSLGLDRSTGWLELLHAMPLLETLRVQSGVVAGKALFLSLYHDSNQASLTTGWPIAFLKRLRLRLLRGFMTDVPGLDYIECLAAAISARKQHGFVLEELEVDVAEVVGLTEDDLAPLALLVSRIVVKCAPPPKRTSPEAETPCEDQHSASEVSDLLDRYEGVDSPATQSQAELMSQSGTIDRDDHALHSCSDTQLGGRKDDTGSACTSESESDIGGDDQSSSAEQTDEGRDSDVEQAIETSDSSTDGDS